MLSLNAIRIPTGQLDGLALPEGGVVTPQPARTEAQPVAIGARPTPPTSARAAPPGLLRTPSTCDRIVAAATAQCQGDYMQALADLTRDNAAVAFMADGISPWKFT